jgi:hypothetical protein
VSTLVPSWAFAGQALDGAGDAVLAAGVHLRVLNNPLLGLPVAPFAVSRINLGPAGRKTQPRTDAVWVDRQGQPRTPPFDITSDNPVTAWLPVPATGICCWAEVDARPHQPVVRRPLDPRVVSRAPVGPGVPLRLPEPLRPPLRPLLPTRAGLAVDAVVTSPLGDAVVATATAAPFQVAASHIERLVVRGSGTVTGLRWIDARTLRGEFFRDLAMPVPPLARYAGLPDGPDLAEERVRRGAPRRVGLHEVPHVAGAGSAPPVTPDEEWDRVEALAGEHRDCVVRLLDDLSAPQWEITDSFAVVDDRGDTIGTSEQPCLGRVLQSTADPGMARWLGYLDVDEEPPAEPGDVVAYLVQGVWQPDLRAIEQQELLLTLPSGAVAAPDELPGRLPDRPWTRGLLERLDGPAFEATVVLCATISQPHAPPPAPAVGPADDGRADRTPPLSRWLPDTPPAARRDVTLPVAGLGPAAGTAFARREGAALVPLNPEDRVGRRRLVVPGVPEDAVQPGAGELFDPDCPPVPVAFRVAQSDWFGRWSAWVEAGLAAGARPRPPRPTLQVTYRQPGMPEPVPDIPLAGTLDVRVQVPGLDALPPGGHLLERLELSIAHGGGAATSHHPVPDPAAPPAELAISLAGPAVPRCGQVEATVHARWVDSSGTASPDSEPTTVTAHDPRPPEPITLPPALRYTSRPDATGRARTTLEWTPLAGQRRFRVFVADETTLGAQLREAASDGGVGAAAAQALLDDLAVAAGAPERAQVYATHRGMLDRDWFQQLTGDPLEAPASGPARFEHAVSGDLRILMLYRVVAVSGANVEAAFASAPLVPAAVPNTGAPSQPAIAALPVLAEDPPSWTVRLEVRVPPGVVPAVAYRLRRGAITSETLRMPVVGEGPVSAAAGEGPQRFVIVDAGGSQVDPAAPLRPWTSYTWRVEVRGADEPGGGPPGEWSTASAPATALIVPPDPPAPVENVTIGLTGGVVRLRWSHPGPLLGGNLGGYTLDVYRQQPSEQLRFLGSVLADEPPPRGRNPDGTGVFTFRDPQDPTGEAPPPGTRYQVVVIDPLGRTSAASPPVEL